MKRIKIVLLVMILSCTLTLSNYPFINAKALKLAKTKEPIQTITVSAAASLKDALTEIKRNFEKQNKQIKILFNFSGSGTLEKQIEAGAPVDIFVSADKKNVNKLNDKNMIDKDSIQDIASNDLVLVVYKGNKIKNINDLSKKEIDRISIGTLGSVPAGDYAKEVLNHYNLWDKVKDKIVYAKDVSAVLSYVKSGNVMAGFVYLTDAKKKSDAIIKQIIPKESHTPIVYEGAIVAKTQYKNASKKFMNYLNQNLAHIILNKYGFGIVPQ